MALIKYGLLTFPAASLGLGFWQLKRLEWKKDLIANLDKKLKDDPLDLLTLDLKDMASLEYRRVKVRGKFDHNLDHQILLKPRNLVPNRESENRGWSAMVANTGVNIVTPFLVDDTNLRILVNRGWLHTRGKDSLDKSAHLGMGNEGESVEVTGILRTSDTTPKYGLKNNEQSNEWQVRDINAMARALQTAPIYLEADEDTTRTQGPIGGQTQLTVRNEHLNYAITWFGLSILCFIMWYGKYGKVRLLKSKRR